jgi:hypothetical protein
MFTSTVGHLHSRLAPQVPIEEFVDLLNPKAFGLEDKSQFYKPICFSIQLGRNASDGAIAMNVPVHANPEWMDMFKKRTAQMLNMKSTRGMEFRTINGKALDKFSIDNLPHVGKLNLFVDGNKVRMDTVPPVPLEYSVQKTGNLAAFYKDVIERDLPDKIAAELLHKNVDQIDEAIRVDGAVQKCIERHIEDSIRDWPEFVRIHHMNSPYEITPEAAKDVLKRVSKDLLVSVRSMVSASVKEIAAYVRAVEHKRQEEKNGSDMHNAPILGREIFSVTKGTAIATPQHGLEMFRKIAADALAASPITKQAVLDTLYIKPLGCKAAKWDHETLKKQRKNNYGSVVKQEEDDKQRRGERNNTRNNYGDVDTQVRERRERDAERGFVNSQVSAAAPRALEHHPWNAQIHHSLKPLAGGVFPAYYNVLHTKQDMTKEAPYAANVEETYKMYHLLVGAPVMPAGRVVNPKTSKGKAPPLIDAVIRPFPNPVPITAEMRQKLLAAQGVQGKMRGLLEPVDCHCSNSSSSEDEEEPVNASITASKAPPVIDISELRNQVYAPAVDTDGFPTLNKMKTLRK